MRKVCRAHDLGSYAQVQGRNQVKDQNRVSTITRKLLKQICCQLLAKVCARSTGYPLRRSKPALEKCG